LARTKQNFCYFDANIITILRKRKQNNFERTQKTIYLQILKKNTALQEQLLLKQDTLKSDQSNLRQFVKKKFEFWWKLRA